MSSLRKLSPTKLFGASISNAEQISRVKLSYLKSLFGDAKQSTHPTSRINFYPINSNLNARGNLSGIVLNFRQNDNDATSILLCIIYTVRDQLVYRFDGRHVFCRSFFYRIMTRVPHLNFFALSACRPTWPVPRPTSKYSTMFFFYAKI